MLAVMFPGLAIPNDKRRESSESETEKTPETEKKKDVDDMMATLESLAPSQQ